MAGASTDQSTNSTAAMNELKRKSGDVGWDYAILTDKNNLQKVKCTLCGKVMSGGIHRLKQHVAQVTGNVASCSKATQEDIAKCQKAINDIGAKKKVKKDHDVSVRMEVRNDMTSPIDLDESEEFEGSKPQRSYGPIDRFTTFDKGKSKQTNLDSVMRKESADRLDAYIARWAYQHAVPFNAVDNDEFVCILEAAGHHGPNGKPPSRYHLGEPLLKKEVDRTKTRMKRYEDDWKISGCSIMTDAWSDRNRRSIMNLCANSSLGTVFLTSKECSDEAHTSDYIYKYIEMCIEKLGPENVVQVMTDNAANNMGAAKLLKVKRPTIFWTCCSAHTINLMLEGIGGKKGFKKTLEEARKITVFIYSHHMSLALMRKYTNKRNIVRPGVTRFASSFLTLQSLLEKKTQLRHMFLTEKWEKCSLAKTKKGTDVKSLVMDDKTWAGVARCLSVFEPLVKVLRMVDADWKPSMGFLHGELKKAQQQIREVFNNNYEKYKAIMEVISTKMEGRLDTCLHLAAYFLNPFYLYNDVSILLDERANDAVVEVVEQMYPEDHEMQDTICNLELPIYRSKEGKFGRTVAIKGCEVNDSKFNPASWWASYGASTPNLRKVAIRILSLTTASSGCERNWSTFEAIHTKKRNRLEAEKVNSLVYVQFNANLMKKNERRKERAGRDVLVSHDDVATEAQDWIIDEGLTYELISEATGLKGANEPRRSSRRPRELFEEFDSASEEELEVDEDIEYESDGVEIREQHYEHDKEFDIDED
ncbi:uncharacterized protein [Rutidosis leptorrhynchoides]|uniref:uncharacterized protein n=1 Tax=Rutidosis leptorrhynchoides TaxID=125765 RepID=UPI003A99E5A7